MAAAAREEKQKQAYEGMGAGGKFRKTPFRRTSHSTPYDRPPTSLRNPSTANDGWLSKLVDPAQRLISYSAHRLFSSVFRRRLPPPQSPSTGVNHEVRIKGKEDVTMYPPGVQKGTVDQSAGPSTTADGGEFTELKQILEQKTFTRSEIDRLTALLHSRTVDIPIENQEKRSEVVPSKPVVSHDKKEEFLKTPVQDKNGIESRLVSNPVVNTSVLHEDVASPAELAKAYMGSRPSKVSPSMLGLRGQAHHEDSPILSSLPIQSKSPMMSLVPWTSGNGGAQENGFVTPRSRGRSAIYNMARTPYSRVRTTTTFKGAGSTVDAYGGASSSQSVLEQSQPSGSKQGVLKRRFSVLDNDVGSVGPIRRIRQKPNLLSSRGLSSPVYSTTSSIRGTRISSEAAQNPPSSIWKPLSLGEPKHNALSENEDNAVPSTSFSFVPSKSSKMASKILEQLDKLVSPKEKSSETNLHTVRDKSPTKLSPSMLRGQALKSLEDVDSSKFMDNVHNNKSNSKLNVSFDRLIPDARDFTSENEDKVKENGPSRIRAPCDSSTILMNGEDSTTEKKDIVPNVKTAVSTASNAVHPPQKKRAFRMSAHEDYLELDDDDNSMVETFSTEKSSIGTATATLEKPPAFSDGSVPAENGTNTIGSSASSFSKMVSTQPSSNTIGSSESSFSKMVSTQPSFTYDKVAPPEESNAGPSMFNFGGKVTSMKDSDAASPVFNYVSKSVDEVEQPQFAFASSPAVGESVDVKSGAFSVPKPESSSSVSAVVAAATNSVLKPLESDKADNKNNAGVSFRIPETAVFSVSSAPSTTGIFSNGTPSNNSSLNNGSTPPFSPSVPSAFLTSPNSSGSMTLTANTNSGNNIASATAVTTDSCNVSSAAPAPSFSPVPNFKVESSTASTAVTTNSSNVPRSNPAPSMPAAPILFESCTASIAVTPVPVNSSLDSFEGKNKEDKGFGNLSSTSFAATSAAIPSTGSGMFGLVSGGAATTSAANQSQGTRFGAGSGSVPISQRTGIASSAASPSFELSGSTGQFGSTSAPNLFSSGASTGLGSSASSLEANSSSSTAPGIFGSSWESPKSPAFASTTSLSAGVSYGASLATSAPTLFGGSSTAATPSNAPFVLGGSSTAAATTNRAPISFGASAVSSTNANGASMMFGSSNGASSTSMSPFTSSAASTAPSQPAFGNPNPAFPFGSSGNNDQMNFVDSMAEDTNQASTPTVPVFGVFGLHPGSNPQSGSVFGSTPAVPSANPFQFSSQQNPANPQNPSPFPASGSLGASQGGSFSLGTGGDKSNRRMVKVKHNKLRKK
ncbi:PREDICTED: nuclear pore complex [Prunus dulcis]|uniref:PREDICTED: nuclear pore complex n=1 Tax=Prunus dulcis TaxID=3755 RepID=A0A5E4G4C1_PRUDU|nr:nuclear pore complex protein NUP1 isoform X1 [Prunus dulcis]VVA34556.1 PREDICTED: nuclear pore complex [Prunus dulcis]